MDCFASLAMTAGRGRLDVNSSRASLVCVPPAMIAQFWPHARPLIESAIARTGLSDFAALERAVLGGEQLLWLAWSDRLEAAGTTELSRVGGATICTLTACGGSGHRRWLHLLAELEAYAAAEGCTTLRIFGRRGWQRLLASYRLSHVILEKDLGRHL